MLIESVEPVGKDRSRVTLEDGRSFVLYKGEMRILKLKENTDLSEEVYRNIMETVLPKRAKLRAMNLLKTRAYTEYGLRKKLAEGGYPAPKNDAEMLSCIYHSLADRYGEVMGMLRELAPFEIERLHIIGGGTNNKLLNQWTEEAVGIPVVAGPTEATAMGNLRVQYNFWSSRKNSE